MFKKYFGSFVAVLLSLSILWTGADVAQAALILRSPETIPGVAELSFLRNQEKMRLETQAMANISIDALDAKVFGSRVPTWGRLWTAWKRIVLRPIHARFPEFTWSLLGAIVSAALVAHFQSILLAAPGVALGCGVIASIGRRSSKEQIAANRARYPFLSRRGIQSTGYRFKYKVEVDVPDDVVVPGTASPGKAVVTKLNGNKKWFGKRGNRVDIFFDELEKIHEETMEKAIPEAPGDVTSQAGHTRYATTGADGSETVEDLTEAAQPATWVPGQLLPRFVADEHGDFKLLYEWLENSFGFNGDADAMKNMLFHLFGKTMDNDELRVLLAKIHYTIDIPPHASFKKEKKMVDAVIPSGDCPTMAGLVDLFHTQGFWFPSLKYAHAVHVRRNLKDLPPSQESMRAWAQWMDVAFNAFRPNLKLQPGQSIEDLSEDQLASFQTFVTARLSSSPDKVATDLKQTLGEDLQAFLYAGIHAFAKNSLPYAVMHEIKPRFEGTIGGKFVSTAIPAGYEDLIVGFFQGQPGSIVVDAAGQNATLASDRRVNQVDEDDKWRIDLNSGVGQIFLLGHNGERITLAIYSGPENTPLTHEEILKMRRDVKDPKQVDPLPLQDPRYLDDQPLESEVRHLPGQLKEMNDAIESGTDSDFLIPATEFTRVLMRNRIYERMRRKIDIGERNIPPDMNAAILKKADELSRLAWMRKKPGDKPNTFDVAQLENAVVEASGTFTRDLIGRGFKGRSLTALFNELRRLIIEDSRPESERVVDILHLLLKSWKEGFLALFPGADSEDRLDTDVKDLVVIGSEKGDYSGTAFAEETARHFGLRQAHFVSNDVLVEAVRNKENIPEFLRLHGIDPERTVVLLTSESGETFDTELACEWIARTVKEVFVMTGGKDNRLSDLVGRNRTFDFHNPLSMEETHFAAYAAVNFMFTRLLVFMGENISSRFGGEKGQWFFKVRWTMEQWSLFRKSLKKLVDEQIPVMMGYKTNHEAIPDKKIEDLQEGEALLPHQVIREQAHYLAEVVKESPTVKIWTVVYIAIAVITGTSVFSCIFSLTGHLLNIQWDGFGTFMQHGFDVLVYSSLVLLATLSRRLLIKTRNWFSRNFTKTKRQWPVPSFLVGFGAKSISIVDSEDYVWLFVTLMGRKAFGMAYGINTPSIEGDKLTKAPHQRGVTATRRFYMLIGRPDGRFKALRVLDDAAYKLGQQTKSILTLPYMWMKHLYFKRFTTPISPHVITFGSGNVEQLKKSKAAHRHLPLPQEETLPIDVPDHVALLYGSRIDAFKRMLVLGRMLTTMSIEVGSQRPYDFTPGRTHPNTGSQTTQCTVPGLELVALLASMPLKVERIDEDPIDHSQPNSFKVMDKPIPTWTPQLEADLKPSSHEEPPTRSRTQSPYVEPGTVPAPVWTAGVTVGRRTMVSFSNRMTRRLMSPRWLAGMAATLISAAAGLVYGSVHYASVLIQGGQRVVALGLIAADWISPYWPWMLGTGILLLAAAILLQFREANHRWPWVPVPANGNGNAPNIAPPDRSFWKHVPRRLWAVLLLAVVMFLQTGSTMKHVDDTPAPEVTIPIPASPVNFVDFKGALESVRGLNPDAVLTAVGQLRGLSQDHDVQQALNKQFEAARNLQLVAEALDSLMDQAANENFAGNADQRQLRASLNAVQGGLSEAKSLLRRKLPGRTAVEMLWEDSAVHGTKTRVEQELRKLPAPTALRRRPLQWLGGAIGVFLTASGLGAAMTPAAAVLARSSGKTSQATLFDALPRTIETVRAVTLGNNDSPWRLALNDGRLADRIQALNPHARWWLKDTIHVPTTIQVSDPGAPMVHMQAVHFFPGEPIFQWVAYHPAEAIVFGLLALLTFYIGYRLFKSIGPGFRLRWATAVMVLFSFVIPGTRSYSASLPAGDQVFKALAEHVAGAPLEAADGQVLQNFFKTTGRLVRPDERERFMDVAGKLDLIQPADKTSQAKWKAFMENLSLTVQFIDSDTHRLHPSWTEEQTAEGISHAPRIPARLGQVSVTLKEYAPLLSQKWIERGWARDLRDWYAQALTMSSVRGGILPWYPLYERLAGSDANDKAAKKLNALVPRIPLLTLLDALALADSHEIPALSEGDLRSAMGAAAHAVAVSGQPATVEAIVKAFSEAIKSPKTTAAVGNVIAIPITRGDTLSQKIIDVLFSDKEIHDAVHDVPFWWGVVNAVWQSIDRHQGDNPNQIFDGENLQVNKNELIKKLHAGRYAASSRRVSSSA